MGREKKEPAQRPKCGTVILALLLALNLFCTAVLLLQRFPAAEQEPDTEYMLYIGLNDRDTYQQELSEAEAREIVETVCLRYTGGCTVQDASGVWTDEKGVATYENTILCTLYDADEATVHQIADELLAKLHQSSILIRKNEVSREYYAGEPEDS